MAFTEVFLKSKTNGAKTAAVGTEVIVMPDVGVDPLTVDYLFAKIDKDGNGKISFSEWQADMKALHHQSL